MTSDVRPSKDIPGSDLLGVLYTHNHPPTADWMKGLPDDIPLEHTNIPGTHDAAAWNYAGPNHDMFNCQDRPLLQQLDAGIRFLDLRFGYSADQTELVFYHATALLSSTTRVQDVLSGMQQWLQLHPTETLLLSMKVDNGPTDEALQNTMYDLIAGEIGKTMWSQLSGELGTLGQVRGKFVLIRRFDWTGLPSTETSLPGINLAPANWADNGLSFIVNYAPKHVANIEDFYRVPDDEGLQGVVQRKYDATTEHIATAVRSFSAKTDKGAFWITFASAAGFNDQGETIYPKPTALGDGSTEGVDQGLYKWLQDLSASETSAETQQASGPNKRAGVILLDFFASVEDLVPSIIRLNF
ncbi:PLC-like phosphodiesterase, partial [Clavulina sp. PMI_390]